ncbi:MAG: transaldolase [Oligoflexia bacterium]|nr:transaldolase [Oligoflexia bacterium]
MNVNVNPLKQLKTFGQSLWLDYIRRDLITSGKLRRLIEEDGLRGMTSNPTIFEKVIAYEHDYDEDIKNMILKKKDAKTIYEAISQHDVKGAADEFRSLYDTTDGEDGYVSLEVNPHLAYETEKTIDEARRLWTSLNRPNVFIKVPATVSGLAAIRKLISEGININITLLFGLPRYQQVIEAYIAGMEERLLQGKPLKHVASVASFFISRIDGLVDPLLEKLIAEGNEKARLSKMILGQVAISNAKVAYQIFKETFDTKRFKKLAKEGARVQRLLWASTGTKNPNYSDTKYVDALIGKDTVNTVPLKTLDAYRDQGRPTASLEQNIEKARQILEQLSELGIDMEKIAQQLEKEGIENFNKPFDNLMNVLQQRILQL